MKKQKGFTLIELLLVLAIIGIISAIAIPALLGQRARARDTTARANVASVMADVIAEYDTLKGQSTAVTGMAQLIGTLTTPIIPQVFTTPNPWATATVKTGYNYATFATETIATPGTATAGLALVGVVGQVQLGFLAPNPATGANGVVAASVYLNNQISINGALTNNFTKTAGID